MSADLTARDAVAREVHLQVPALSHGPIGTEFVADAVLAALAAAGWRLERDDQWEWSTITRHGIWCREVWTERPTAEDLDHIDPRDAVVVRRRPAGEWEVAPDA